MTQAEALDILKLGHNVYLTGPAGSGKTYLLNKYIKYLRAKDIPVAVTASTGIAATHMNGMTIHSWARLGIKDELSKSDLRKMLHDDRLNRRFSKTKVLIIDEVSMLHSFRLDMVDRVLREFRPNHLPFGGIQVILCGDFFQLPPVSRDGGSREFVHASQAWQEMDIKVCYLEEQHRQEDQDFLTLLNEIRANDVSQLTQERLNARFQADIPGVSSPTKLYTHNANVEAINDARLEELPGIAEVYDMTSRGDKRLIETLTKSCLAPEELRLKKGAAVMFVKNNFEKGYVNGTLGEVVSFDSERRPVVKTVRGKKITAVTEQWSVVENERTLASVSQIPLRLAWAITVHKSQGMSLDAAEIDLSRSFEPGMGYVALSRVRTLRGIKLMGANQMALRINEEALQLDGDLRQASQESLTELRRLKKDEMEKSQKGFIASLG